MADPLLLHQWLELSTKYVTKRNGKKENLNRYKIIDRIQNASRDLRNVDANSLTEEILVKLPDGISTKDIDEYIADFLIGKAFENVEYDTLASNIVIFNHQKKIKDSFSVIMNKLCVEDGIINPACNAFIQENAIFLDEAIDYKRDFLFNFSGFKTLANQCLLKNSRGEVVERPQDMMMRVAVCVSDIYTVSKKERLDGIIETYNAISLKHYTHNLPTLFYACTSMSHLSSYFLLTPRADDVIGLTETFSDIARIAVNTGGVGLNLQDYPAIGSYFQETNTVSPGSIPMIKTLNNLLNAINNTHSRVAIAIYTEPWHPDILNFLALNEKNQLVKDISFGLWMPDLFMERLENNNPWTLMCPKMCPGLSNVWGNDFRRLYEQYEEQYPDLPRVSCSDIWSAVIKSQLETGMPYICYKDAVNRKSNQKHIGTIKCSSLSTESMEYSSHDETAVCNLASIAVNTFVNEEDGTFDFEKLREITKLVTRNLDNAIRATCYHTKRAGSSNYRHKPIGIGVQGLADTFAMLGYAFDSAEAKELDVRIFENMYYAAVETSCELAKERGVYLSYRGSPASQGKLQFDMWRDENRMPIETTLDWDKLKKEKLSKYGMRNSYLLALMPTPCTAMILGNSDSIEPFKSNIISTRFLNSVNKHLVKRLTKQGMWNSGVCNVLATTRGSIQDIDSIDADTKLVFRTVWEIPQKSLIEMAAARAPFIDQSQSLNIHISASPYQKAYAKVNALHRTIWNKSLKTGLHHLRKGPNAIQFTANEKKARETRKILAADRRSRKGSTFASQ